MIYAIECLYIRDFLLFISTNNEKFSTDDIDSDKQFYFNHEDRKIVISTFGAKDPNRTSARVGLIYPWALRPALIRREAQFDFFDYGEDLEEPLRFRCRDKKCHARSNCRCR